MTTSCFKDEAKKKVRLTMVSALLLAGAWNGGCEPPPKPYGVEARLRLPTARRQVWAVGPAINLSGETGPDPLLQADLVYEQLQQVQGLVVVPVNRVVETYAGLRLENIKSAEQAYLVCDLLGCDGLVIPTVTVYDPYDPPKMGASLQLFRKPRDYKRPDSTDLKDLARSLALPTGESLPQQQQGLVQVVGLYDASNGSIRQAVLQYAQGRHDPQGPMGSREFFESMDRYCGFVYNALATNLLRSIPKERGDPASSRSSVNATGRVDER